MKIICPCGTEFNAANWQIKSGKGKYCSKSCMYKFRTRTSGMKYDLKVENPTWVKPGQHLSPDTEFVKGVRNNPDGEIKSGQRLSVDTEFKKGNMALNWKGDEVGYTALHSWVARHKGKATSYMCDCGSPAIHWANLSHEYLRDLDDYKALCGKCHNAYDKGRSDRKRYFDV